VGGGHDPNQTGVRKSSSPEPAATGVREGKSEEKADQTGCGEPQREDGEESREVYLT